MNWTPNFSISSLAFRGCPDEICPKKDRTGRSGRGLRPHNALFSHGPGKRGWAFSGVGAVFSGATRWCDQRAPAPSANLGRRRIPPKGTTVRRNRRAAYPLDSYFFEFWKGQGRETERALGVPSNYVVRGKDERAGLRADRLPPSTEIRRGGEGA